MTVTFVEPTTTPQTVNVLLYGPPGTGKTVGACSAPGPVLVINAEGPSALRYARKAYGEDKIREVRFESGQTLDDVYKYLKEGSGGEQTVVLDTIGEVYEALVVSYAGNGRPQLQHYGDVNTKLDRFVRALRDLDLNVVLLAHEQIDDSDGQLTRRPATGGKKLPEKVMAQMDLVAYTGVVVDDDGPRYMGQLVEGNGRRAKDRSGVLGAARELDLSEWFQTIAEEMKPAPILEADAEQLLTDATASGLAIKDIAAWFVSRGLEGDLTEYPEVKSKKAAVEALGMLDDVGADDFRAYVAQRTVEQAA